MKREIIYYGHPFLRKKAAPVESITEEIKQIVDDLIETMHAYGGIGLAATQIAVDARIFITYISKEDSAGNYLPGVVKVYINPEILEVSDEITTASEGCLSIPKLRADVGRPFKVRIKALDLDGTPFIEEVTDYEAHAVLHENDHLNGVLYVDRIHGKERKYLEPKLRAIKKKYHP